MKLVKWLIVFLSPFIFHAPVYARVIPMQFFTYRELRLPGPDAPNASGSGTYDDNREKPSLSLSFQRLVPNALYSVWCSTVRLPMTVANSRPCGALDWSNDAFRTDSSGNGTVYTPLPSPLPPSMREEVTMISVVYERDGRPHQDTKSWGTASYPQLLYFYPSFASSRAESTNQVSPWWTAGILGMLTLGAYAVAYKFLG